jgi:hypothetical protein
MLTLVTTGALPRSRVQPYERTGAPDPTAYASQVTLAALRSRGRAPPAGHLQ